MKSINLLVSCVMALVFSTKAMAQEPDFLFEQPGPFEVTLSVLQRGGFGVIPLPVPDNAESDGFCLLLASEPPSVSVQGTEIIMYEPEETHQPVAYLLASDGTVIRERNLGFEGRYSYLLSVVQDPNDIQACLALGLVHDINLHYDRPFLAKLDYNLNLVWQKEIELPESCHHTIFGEGYAIDVDGEVVCMVFHCDYNVQPTYYHNVYFKVTSDGELAGVFEYPNLIDVPPQCELFPFRDGSGDFGHIVDEQNPSDGQTHPFLLRISSDMELLERKAVQNYFSNGSGGSGVGIWDIRTAFFTSDTEMIYGGSGNQVYHPGQGEHVIAFFRVNGDGDVEDYFTSGGNPSVVVDSLRVMISNLKCSDLSGDDAFVFFFQIGKNGAIGDDYTYYFAVEKGDFKSNTLWRRYWDRYHPEYGMRVYVPTAIAATDDGGCLVAGYSYYSDINEPWPIEDFDPQTSIFLLKVFADGTLSSPEAEAFVRPYACYPNPADDVLHLEFSPDAVPTLVELYDMQGRHVLCQRSNFGSIATEDLPAGVYTIKVTLEGGKSYSETIIKN